MLIELEDVGYTYMPGTAFSQEALKSVSIAIREGEFVAIAGPTGSGKSTLVQLLGGLIKPATGRYLYNRVRVGRNTDGNVANGMPGGLVGREIGLVFQFPEAQLFEETVEKDIAFGPRNLGLSEDSIEKRVRDSIARIGLEYDKIAHRSPFELSGGEKRLVAMAGVLAMNPRVLVLDEPTSGLDADGKDRIMRIINGLNETGTTIILVTHDMNDVADFAERVVVFNDGRIVIDGVVENVFADTVLIEMFGELGLGIPVAVQVLLRARERGLAFELGAVRINDVVDRIKTVRGPCFREGDAGE